MPAVEAFYYTAVGAAGWGKVLAGFVLPSVLGNTIGGVLVVALLNHGQVVAEKAGHSEAVAPGGGREPNRRRRDRRVRSPVGMPT